MADNLLKVLSDTGRFFVRRFSGKSYYPYSLLGNGDVQPGAIGRNNDLAMTKYGAALAYCLVEPVFRAVDLRGRNVGRMPWQIVSVETGEVIDRSSDPRPKHPLSRAIHDVRRRRSDGLFTLWETALCLYGENYLEKVPSLDGSRILSLRWLNPLGVTIVETQGRIGGYQYTSSERIAMLDPHEVAYDRTFNAFDDLRGFSPTYNAINKANIELNADRTWSAYYRNGARPDGLITPKEGVFEEEDLNVIQATWQQFKGAANSGKLGLFPFAVDVNFYPDRDFVKQIPLSEHVTAATYRIYGVPQTLAGDTTAGPYQGNTDEVHQNFFITTVRPECEAIAESVNNELVPHFDYPVEVRFEFDYSDYEHVGESQTRKIEYIDRQVQAGILSLARAQEEMGYEPDERLEDIYLIGGKPYPVEVLRNLWKLELPQVAPAAAPPGLPSPSAPAALPAPAPAAQAGVSQRTHPAVKADPNPAFVYLSLANDPQVLAVMNGIRIALEGVDGIRWQPAPLLHLSLVTAPDVPSDDTLRAVAAWPGTSLAPVDLFASRLGLFENGEERALHLAVEMTVGLERVQQQSYDQFGAREIDVSPYSTPDQFIPHITLAYLPPGTEIPDIGEIDFKTTATQFCVARADYQPVVTVQLHDVAVWLDERATAMRAELAAWQKFALAGRHKSRPFEPDTTRGDLAEDLTAALALVDGQEAIKAVFDEMFHRVAVRAIDHTRATFEAQFADLLLQARDGKLSRSQWSARVRQLLLVAGNQAYLDGLRDGGVEDEPDDEDLDEIERILRVQSGYVTELGRVLFKTEDGVSDAAADIKPGLWSNKSLNEFYYAGVLSAAKNGLGIFQGPDGTESCDTCQRLKGQVHRYRDWERKGLVPQKHTAAYVCGGWQCEHSLKPYQGKARGNWLKDPPGKWA